MSVAEKLIYTPEEYLERERNSDTRHELVNGEIYAMAGASESHSLITANLIIEIGGQLRGRPCRAYTSDMKVRVSETGLYTYPDLSALCGEPEFLNEHRDVLLNPALIVEVLSPSTEAYDRGAKFAHYRRQPSVREYLLVSQDQMRLELFTAEGDGSWRLTEFTEPDQEVRFSSVGVGVRLENVYNLVTFPAEAPVTSA